MVEKVEVPVVLAEDREGPEKAQAAAEAAARQVQPVARAAAVAAVQMVLQEVRARRAAAQAVEDEEVPADQPAAQADLEAVLIVAGEEVPRVQAEVPAAAARAGPAGQAAVLEAAVLLSDPNPAAAPAVFRMAQPG